MNNMNLNGSLHDNVYDLLELEKEKILEILRTCGAMTIYDYSYCYDHEDRRFDLELNYKLAQRDRWECQITIDYSDGSVTVELTDDAWSHRRWLEGELEREIKKIL